MKLSIKNISRRPRPRLNFRAIAEHILNADYELSLVLVGDARAQTLNRVWRGQNRPTNVLSFPLDSASGEIFLNLAQAAREARAKHQPAIDYLRFLFIHGLLHLKGLNHGSKMESLESQLAKHFKTHEQNHRRRTRCRQHLRALSRL